MGLFGFPVKDERLNLTPGDRPLGRLRPKIGSLIQAPAAEGATHVARPTEVVSREGFQLQQKKERRIINISFITILDGTERWLNDRRSVEVFASCIIHANLTLSLSNGHGLVSARFRCSEGGTQDNASWEVEQKLRIGILVTPARPGI